MGLRSMVSVGAIAGVCWCAHAGGVVLDGVIDPGEGYTHLIESTFGAPFGGGSATNSDFVGESASFSWFDGLGGVLRTFNDNRADIVDVFVAWDAFNLYVAVVGPNAVFNNWNGGGTPETDNDQADLFIALDVAGGTPAGQLTASSGHKGFGAGPRAVDFLGWTPTHVIGVQYVDNGGGGGGFANVERTGAAPDQVAGEAHDLGDGGFDWAQGINASSDGVFEIAVPWTDLGFSGNVGIVLRLSAFTTQNFAAADTYDSGPAGGNGFFTEQIGDCNGDTDVHGAIGACDAGPGGSPCSNFVPDDLTIGPGRDEGIDTIEEYYELIVSICEGDANLDGVIDVNDIAFVIFRLGATGTPGTVEGDADGNGVVDVNDVAFVIFRLGPCPL